MCKPEGVKQESEKLGVASLKMPHLGRQKTPGVLTCVKVFVVRRPRFAGCEHLTGLPNLSGLVLTKSILEFGKGVQDSEFICFIAESSGRIIRVFHLEVNEILFKVGFNHL